MYSALLHNIRHIMVSKCVHYVTVDYLAGPANQRAGAVAGACRCGSKCFHVWLQVLAEYKQKTEFNELLARYEEKPVCEGRSLDLFLTYPMHQVQISSSPNLCTMHQTSSSSPVQCISHRLFPRFIADHLHQVKCLPCLPPELRINIFLLVVINGV